MPTETLENSATTAPPPPGPRGVLLARDLEQVQHGPLQFLLDMTRRYGDLVRYETAYGVTYLVNSPELIAHVLRSPNFPRGSLLTLVLGQGLLASEGDWWRQQRSLMLPSFHPRAINSFANNINRAVLSRLRLWREYSARGETIDVAAEMLHLTLQVVVETLFSGDLNDERAAFYDAIKLLLADVGGFVCSEFVAPVEISPERNRRIAATLGRINEIVHELIRARRRHDDREDLLSLLLQARNENGEGLSDKEIRDEIVTMVFAGNETTATALSWTFFAIAQYRGVETCLQQELDEVLAGRVAQLEDLQQLPYLKMTLNEAMRVYPPVWSIFRKVREDEVLAGYSLRGGHTLVVSPYAMHHHPQHWPQPERFDPQRFTPETEAARPRHAYIPFGGGRHVCIGKHFALLEAQLVLAAAQQCFTMRVAPGAVIEAEPLVTLRFKHGLPMQVTLRRNAAQILG